MAALQVQQDAARLTAMPFGPVATPIVCFRGITASASPSFTSLVANTALGGNPASRAAGWVLLLHVPRAVASALQDPVSVVDLTVTFSCGTDTSRCGRTQQGAGPMALLLRLNL